MLAQCRAAAITSASRQAACVHCMCLLAHTCAGPHTGTPAHTASHLTGLVSCASGTGALCSCTGPEDRAAVSSRAPTPRNRQCIWHCLLTEGFALHLKPQAELGLCPEIVSRLLQPSGPSCSAICRACAAGQLQMPLRLPFHVSLLTIALYLCRACTLRSRQPLAATSPSQAMACCSTSTS